MSQPELHNAIIKSTSLGIEEHGIFSCYLFLEWEGGGIGFGGFALDSYDENVEERVDKEGTIGEYIKIILDTVGVDNWEDLKGKYVVVETGGWGSTASGIRHITNEKKWFRPKEWFEART